MSKRYDRTVSLIGEDNLERLHKASVLVAGLGGVGGAAVEALARSGIGRLVLVDGDVFEPSNLNRQILCTERDLGRNKAEAAAERVNAVNSEVSVTAVPEYLTESNIDDVVCGVDWCIDAIDDIPNKIELISACKRKNINIVSAMGAGNRLDCAFALCDISKTCCDPFAKIVRKKLREKGIDSLDVVCATSPPFKRESTPASIAPPPMAMGAMLASAVLNGIIIKP